MPVMIAQPLFSDRRDAGRQLAERLARYRNDEVVVLALPRGGVPVAYEVARALGAPLDVVVARKVGAPGRPELGVGAVAPGGVVLNDEAADALGLTDDDLAPVVAREREEVERRLARYRGGGTPDVAGKTVVLVDDGLATGVTARAAVRAVRQLGPARVVLAVPVCARETAGRLADEADAVVCVAAPGQFRSVGQWYDDFRQTSDEEVLRLLEAAGAGPARPSAVRVDAGDVVLEGDLEVPEGAVGVVLFTHGSGSSRHSRRNRAVARRLREAGLATLLFDLLTPEEEEADRRARHLRFDVPMLAARVAGAARWLGGHETTRTLPVGVFGASTGGGAALVAAADAPQAVRAVVSRGGRPDLAGDALARVEAPTLLVVGGRDLPTLETNREAMDRMDLADVRLEVVPGAGHLFEEPGALERVAGLAARHFRQHLGGDGRALAEPAEPPDEAEVYRTPKEAADTVARHAEPFGSVDDAGLDALLDRIGDARVVCIGEASHGTHEFYALRARVTQRLVEERGFRIVACEADWPDMERVDAYVRGRDPDEREWEAFARFPTWMWRNEPVRDFVERLRDWNDGRDEGDRAGMFGLDVYSLYTSMGEVLGYLGDRDPELAAEARARYGCFAPFSEDPALYGRAVVSRRYQDCEGEAVRVLQDLLRQRLRLTAGGDGAGSGAGTGAPEAFPFFDAAQNARVVRDAEAYYRGMFYGNVSTWNLRDTHMMGTLRGLLGFFGEGAKAVVWAHNSHLGDAAATEMGRRGEINLGHLCRRQYGDGAYLVGFGTHTGTVLAARNWDEDGEVRRVRPSHPESYEWVAHESGVERFFLPLRGADRRLRDGLGRPRLERAIGVVYRPETELQSHYFPAVLPDQFDEWVWIDETRALTPLGPAHAPDLPRAHPFRLLAD